MPTKTFNFASSQESWTWTNTSGSMTSAARNATDQALEVHKDDPDGEGLSAAGYWQWEGTWEALGVTAGHTVTHVDGDYDWRCTEATNPDTSLPNRTGPFELRNTSNVLQDTFSASQNFSSTSSWATKNGSNVAVPSGLQASTSTIRLRLAAQLGTLGSFTDNGVKLQHDNIVLTITTTGGETLTGSGTFNVGAATLSASATHTPPTFSATSAMTIGAATMEGVGGFTAPVYSATGDLVIGPASLSAAGTFTAPVYSGTAAMSVGAAALSGSSVHTPPTFTGIAALTVGPPALLSGTAIFDESYGEAAAALSVGAALLSSSGTFTAPTFTASATLSVGAATAQGAATFAAPVYSGAAALAVGAPQMSASAAHTPPTFTASAPLTIGPAVLSAAAGFTPSGLLMMRRRIAA